ncbi:MAG: ABC transporter permease [Pseudomonadales bacterium]
MLIKLAFRNLLRQRRRTLLTGLSMTGGYMLFVFAISLSEGSWNGVVDIFTLDSTGHIQVHKDDYAKRPKIHKTIHDRAQAEAVLQGNEDIAAFAPRVHSAALAYFGNKTSPSRVIGIDPQLEPHVTRIRDKVSAGSYFNSAPDADGYFQAMVGQGLANTLKLGLGDELVLISSGADGSIANDIFIVQAIIGNKTSFDRLAVYLPLSAAQDFLTTGGDVHEYALLVEDRDDNEDIAEELQASLPSLTVSPWQVIEATFHRTMQSDKQRDRFSLGLLVSIVFVGVLNTVLMSVLERTREFGVLRAVGSRPYQLVRLIFLETVMLSGISLAIGMALIMPVLVWFTRVGMEMPIAVDMGGVLFTHMKGEISLYVFLMPMAFMLLVAALVSLPPGLRAARILIRDALGSH